MPSDPRSSGAPAPERPGPSLPPRRPSGARAAGVGSAGPDSPGAEPSGATPTVLEPRAFALDLDGTPPGVPTLLRALAGRPGLVALDSAGGWPTRRSIVAFEPRVSFGLGAKDSPGPRGLGDLHALLSGHALGPRSEVPEDAAFAGGFIGALAYDLGVHGEDLDLPAAVWPAPPIVGGIFGDWIEVEHDESGAALRTTLYLSTPNAEERAHRLRTLDAAIRAVQGAPPAAAPAPDTAAPTRTVPPEEHVARIERTRDLIARGEIYQANVAHRMTAPATPDALALYLRLREVNAAPYMGYLPFRFLDGAPGALLSASPELLLEVDPGPHGAVARTRPIKGTVPRGTDPEDDARQRERLLASAKDRAELAMIVDLERNDLGRIARPGGVRVHGFPTLQTYATVHHLVADVEADLAEGAGALDAVASLFPGGSITGAPKLRSMEAIAELEGEGRGFFTGSLGFVDLRGAARFNILIRTLVHRAEHPDGPAEVSFHVGGGITWSSDAAAEDEETLHKAAGLLLALSPG